MRQGRATQRLRHSRQALRALATLSLAYATGCDRGRFASTLLPPMRQARHSVCKAVAWATQNEAGNYGRMHLPARGNRILLPTYLP